MNESLTVKPIGSYLYVDENGFIVNPASIEKLQPKWAPVVRKVKEGYLKHFGESLHSVYIRGTVAKGEAIENVSDVDSFAVVTLPSEKIDGSWAKDFAKEVMAEYPFVAGVEVDSIPLQELEKHKADQLMLKTQSVCVYGENLADKIAPMKPGKAMAQHVKYIKREILKTREWFQGDHTDVEIRRKCTWIMKRLLRSGFELVMERSQKYTRDLYPCYKGFAEYYPDKKDEMHQVLELAVNPAADKAEIVGILDDIGVWVIDEIKQMDFD